LLVAEEIGAPTPFQRVIAVENRLKLGLYQAGKGLVLLKTADFIFSHKP
jgi:hypothetical protein